jgi:hypothetical protein
MEPRQNDSFHNPPLLALSKSIIARRFFMFQLNREIKREEKKLLCVSARMSGARNGKLLLSVSEIVE